MATAGYNRIVLVGNLTRDPDYKQLTSGQGVCRLGLASNRQYRNKQTGSMVQEVCFVDVDVFGPQAESCRQYLAKGRLVLIEGRLKFDTWDTPEGQKRGKHSIVADRVVFLSFSSQNEDVGLQQEAGVERQEDFEAATKPYAKKKAKTQRSSATSDENSQSDAGELSYQDEPPFQDDLPF